MRRPPRRRKLKDCSGQAILLQGDPNVIIDCKRCGRPLRDTKSKRLGYGPVCYAKSNGKLHQRKEP